MTTTILTEEQMRAMLGDMHADYIDAVRAHEQRRDELQAELIKLKAEVARLRAKYEPTDNEGSEL
jgi:anti-sigma factor RsiW